MTSYRISRTKLLGGDSFDCNCHRIITWRRGGRRPGGAGSRWRACDPGAGREQYGQVRPPSATDNDGRWSVATPDTDNDPVPYRPSGPQRCQKFALFTGHRIIIVAENKYNEQKLNKRNRNAVKQTKRTSRTFDTDFTVSVNKAISPILSLFVIHQ